MITLLRHFVVALLSAFACTAMAQTEAERIAGRLGPLAPHASRLADMAAAMSVAGLYAGSFAHTDRLDNASWEIVQNQLGGIAKRIGADAVKAADGSNNALRKLLVAELSKLDPAQIMEISSFLESPDGEKWLNANKSYSERLPEAFRFAVAHGIVSRQRGQKLLENVDQKRMAGMVAEIRSIIMLSALTHSAGNEPSFYAFLSSVPLMDMKDAKLAELSKEMVSAVSSGIKNGLGANTLQKLMQSINTSLRSPSTMIDLFRLRLQNLDPQTRARIDDLVARSLAAMDGSQTSQCRFPAREGVIEKASVDVGQIMAGGTPVKPGSVEHSWVAQWFERGCGGKKDFATALKIWEDIAHSGNVRTYCTVSNYYRLGVGTRPDSQKAREWNTKFSAAAEGRNCEEIKFNPEKPWQGL